MEAWRDELYHHGILGQKWGRKNGPPYPLGSGDHSASEKKAGWRKSLSQSVKDHKTKKKRAKAAAKARKAKKQKAEEAKNKEKNLRDPLWLKKHASELTNEELRSARERLQLENDLRSQSIRKINAGKEYADMVLGYLNTGVNAYDTVSKIYNKVDEIKSSSENKQKEARYKKEAKDMSDKDLENYVKRSKYEETYVKRRMGKKEKDKD